MFDTGKIMAHNASTRYTVRVGFESLNTKADEPLI